MQIEGKKRTLRRIVISSLFVILFGVVGTLMLKYEVEGETNMPFKLTKISIVSTASGINREGTTENWNLELIQNNDIYLNFQKNNQNNNDVFIKKVSIENITIKEQPAKGEVKFYRAIAEGSNTNINKEEYSIKQKVEYSGDTESNLEQLKIGNQGGIVGIRCAIENLGEYVSNNTEIRIDGTLLKETNVTPEDLFMKIGFDIILEVTSGVRYKAYAELDLPCGNIIEEGICKNDITDLKEIVFKRF